MSFYRNILKQAWRLTWRNKYLWWFGVFAALLGNGGELEILFNRPAGGQELFPAWRRLASTGIFSRSALSNIGDLFQRDTLNMIFILTVGLASLAVFLFLVWLVVVSQAALVNNSAAAIKQKKHNFREGINAGVLNFWPVLVLNFLVKAAVYLLFAAISLPLIFSPASFGAKLFYIFALIVSVPLVIVLSFIMKYAVAYVVISRFRLGQAIKRGWLLFKENWLISFEMAVILFLINLLAGFGIILAILTLAVPFLFLGLISYYSFALIGPWFIAALAFTSFLLIILVIGAALSVFQISSWTGLFLELNKNGGTAKLVRVINSIVKA